MFEKLIRLFALDEYPIILSGYREIFARAPDINLEESFTSPGDLLRHQGLGDIDQIIVGNNNGNTCVQTGISCGEICKKTQLVLLVEEFDADLFREGLRAGYRGFISKAERPETILTHIREIHAGRFVVSDMLVPMIECELKNLPVDFS